ncbi:MAG: SCO family protein [Alphaproteobacteria bacterium]
MQTDARELGEPLHALSFTPPQKDVFDAMRDILQNQAFDPGLLAAAFAFDLVYLALGLAAVLFPLDKARACGMLLAVGDRERNMSDQPKALAWLGSMRNLAWVAVFVAGLGALGLSFYQKRTAVVKIGGAFALTDQAGARVTDQDLVGKVSVVYFGFTHCPDVCPTALTTIGAALKEMAPADRKEVVPVFVTLDPERDTPEIMKDYVEGFIPGGVGLTGTKEEIAEMAREYRVAYQKVADPNSALPYTIDHASIVYVMDRHGKYFAHFTKDMTAGELAKAMTEAVRKD